jgi:cystathionine beta-lyase
VAEAKPPTSSSTSASISAFALARGELTFEVDHRRPEAGQGGEGGPSLRVRDAAGRERLRFDCFRFEPHLHVDDGEPEGFGPVADPVSFAIDALSRDLAGWLLRSGLEQPVRIDAEELRETLARVENALRNPPARLADLDPRLLATRLSEKWHTYPRHIQPAWVAEMDFPLAEPIRVVLERAVDRYDFGYPIAPNETGLCEAFCARMLRLYGWPAQPERVEILTDVVQGLFLGLLAYSEPGDGAIVQTPIYPPFLQAVRETGRALVEHRLAPPREGNPGFALDVERLRALADARTRVVLLCNPHNPTGRVFRRDELVELAELARERDWVVVVDEIHQDLVYPEGRHIPFATLSDDAASRTVTVTSATKAFNIPGLRTAAAHFGSAELQRRFNRAVPRHVRGGIGLPGLYATIAAWRHGDPWLEEVRAQLALNRALVLEVLSKEVPEIACRAPEATYLAWLDCRELGLSPSPARFFYERAEVALSDGSNFGPGQEGFARLNFATSPTMLGEILEKLVRAVRTRGPASGAPGRA